MEKEAEVVIKEEVKLESSDSEDENATRGRKRRPLGEEQRARKNERQRLRRKQMTSEEREKINERRRKYREENAERVRTREQELWQQKRATPEERAKRTERRRKWEEQHPDKREKILAKNRFRSMMKLANMTEEERRAYNNKQWLARQAKVAEMTKEEREEMLKKNREQVAAYYKSLTGEKLEQVKMKQKEASRRQAKLNWQEHPEKLLAYLRKRVARETPEQRQKRLRGYKINASRRKLKIELEEEGVLSPEEIKRQLKEFVDKLRSEPLPPIKPEEISEYKPRISGRKPKKTGRRWEEMIGVADVHGGGGEAAPASTDRLQCTSSSTSALVGVAPCETLKLNVPQVSFASESYPSPFVSRLPSSSLPRVTIHQPDSPARHLDSPCNSPAPNSTDSLGGDDDKIGAQLPTSGEFLGDEALPILSARFKCSSTSVRVVANESSKLNAPPVLIASVSSFPWASQLTSALSPLPTIDKPDSPPPPSPSSHFDSPCNSPLPDPTDLFDGDDGDIEPQPQLPTSADFAEPVPALSVISSPEGGPRPASPTEAPWKCPVCSELLQPDNLAQHLSIDHAISRNNYKSPKKYKFLCTRCPWSNNMTNKFNQFKTRHHLFNHVLQHHPSSYWPCPCCSLLLYSESRLKIHLSHCISTFKISSLPNICELCGKTLDTLKAYNSHKRRAHPANGIQLKCPKCERIFQQIRTFWCHFVKCRNPEVVALPISLLPQPTQTPFRPQKNKTKQVQKRHSSKGPIPCDQCGKTFLHECTLDDHIRREHEGTSHICPESGCSRNFQSAGKLWRHQTEYHKIADLPPPPGVDVAWCKYCGELVMRGYERHVKKMHSEWVKDFELHVLPEHKKKMMMTKINNPIRRFKNTIPLGGAVVGCWAGSSTFQKCHFCPKELPRDSLRRHMDKEHLNSLSDWTKKVRCEFCSKELLRGSLKRHMYRNHVDPSLDRTKVKCNFCPLVLNRDSLNKHVNAKHWNTKNWGRKPFQCPICKQDFNAMDHYSVHYIFKHVYGDIMKILESQKLIMKKESTNLMVCQICNQEMPDDSTNVRVHFAVSHYDKLLEYFDKDGNSIPATQESKS